MDGVVEGQPGDVSKEMSAEELRVANLVAEAIGGDVTPERVHAVIKASNDKKMAFHGVRRIESVDDIEMDGVAANSHGQVSFWTGGRNIFHGGGNSPVWSFDTTFFNYGHSRGDDESMMYGRIVATDEENLRKLNSEVSVPRDGYMTYDFQVPRDKICILETSVPRDPNLSPRENGQRQEQEMFRLMERVTQGEFVPGGAISNTRAL